MLGRLLRSPGALVYGTVTVGAVLDAEGIKTETFAKTLFGVALAMVLLWLAHSYAQITGHRFEKGEQLTPRMIWHHMAQEAPILAGAVVPLLTVIAFWAAGSNLGDALSAGIWADVAMIVVINVVAAFVSDLTGIAILVQTAVGVTLGIGIIVVKLIFH
jgi:hypothetical protein